MFRLIRLVIFVAMAFVVGMFYERQSIRESCEAAGGSWSAETFCDRR